MSQLNTLKPLMIALLLSVMSLTVISAMAGTAVDTRGHTEKARSAVSVSALGASCSPYFLGDTGPDRGKVFYVDSSGCHGLEAQVADAALGGVTNWSIATSIAATYNTTSTNAVSGYNCTTATNVKLTSYCWHLPTKTELQYLYAQKARVGGFGSNYYWSSSEYDANNAWYQSLSFGYQNFNYKSTPYLVRAVRAF